MNLLSKRNIIHVFLAVALCLFALGAMADSKVNRDAGDVYHDLEVFAKIVEKITAYYVDEVNTHELLQEAINSMLEQLDPHSQFLEGLAYEDLMVSTRGEFGGLGIYISFRDNYPTVIAPIDDTPGDRAGLRGGDQIIEIEGMPTEGWRIDKAIGYLRGDPGTDVRFKVSRPGLGEAIDYVITREVINVKSVRYSGMFGDYGYIKVSNFSKNTSSELKEALKSLEKQGMKGLVLDFRTNPGGLLQTATEVTELFLEKDKLVVYTKGRLPNSNHKYWSTNKNIHNGYPIVVMINGASASASEIFAGALQDWDAALVVGQTSFGKGTVQTVFSLSDTEAVKLTTARYYTPSGRSIHNPEEEADVDILAASGDVETQPDEFAATEETTTKTEEETTSAETADVPAEKPVYYTSSGRIVYGGGGITPDIEFEPQLYTDLQRRMERDGLAFSFVVDYLQDHEIQEDFEVTDGILQEFYSFIKDRDFEYKEADLTAENVDYIKLMIAREAVSNKFGRKAMFRVVLEKDPEFQQVLSILEKSPTLSDLFKYAEEHRSIKEARTGTQGSRD